MARFGFCSGFYQSQSVAADDQDIFNWYPETIESGEGKSAKALYPRPGLDLFCALPDVPLASYNANGRAFFACADGNLYELFSNGTKTSRAAIPGWTGGPVSICGSTIQLVIANGNNAYCYDLRTNSITDITGTVAKPNPVIAQYGDGFFLMFFNNSQFFQVSAANDGTTWSGVDTYQVSVYPDNVVSMLFDHREMWLWGIKASQVYYNSGAASNPWTPIPGAFVEQGCAAIASPVKLDNSVFWIGSDERGNGIAWRANGYTPVRVSTHAVENAWSRYSTIADAIGYSYVWQGHSFWVIYFPTANATWVLDVGEGLWSRMGFWNQGTATYDAHHSRNHVFIFGKHLVGDWSSGNIYALNGFTFTDNGSMIRWMRRAPYISSQGQWIFFSNLEIDLEAGVALQAGQGSDPQMTVRWSNDRGKSWGNDHLLSAGKVGDYGHRLILRRLGKCWGTSGRIFEVSATDPVPWRITDAYVEAAPGFTPSERLTKQYEKVG